MDPYDIGNAFAEIEDELIESMIRNMRRHRIEEIDEKKEWTQWQAEQLKALEAYKKRNRKKFPKKFNEINGLIDKAIKEARAQGNMDQELEILTAIKSGFAGYRKADADVIGEFFKVNNRKLDTLIKATEDDFKRGERAILRMAEDQYRQIIFNAQVYANTGAGTYEQAVDMATKDFLSRGINCIEYKNGARHTMKDYADMAIRTAAKRAYLAGEGEKRMEWGISTVIVNKRGNACPKCVPFVGKVLIDDVYSGGKKSDGDYPLLSRAMELGLYHPRCKDTHTTYFPGVSTADDKWTKKELEAIGEEYKQEQKQMYAQRQAERFDRMAKHSLYEEDEQKYSKKAREWSIREKLIKKVNQIRKPHHEFIKDSFADSLKNVFDRDLRKLWEGSLLRIGIKESPRKKSFYSHGDKTVYLAPSAKESTLAHELFHEIDRIYGLAESGMFIDAIKNDFKNLENLAEQYGMSVSDMIESAYPKLFVDKGIMLEKCRGISDILHGMSKKKVYFGYGHNRPGYWDKPYALEKETWAQYGRMLYENDEAVLAALQELFPETTQVIWDTIKGMIK